MRKRHQKLKLAIETLGIEFDEPRPMAVQPGIFLAQIWGCGDFEPSEQTGFFFKWRGGPRSSGLVEAYDELVCQMNFENATGTPTVNSSLVENAGHVKKVVEPKSGVKFCHWIDMVAVVAYMVGVGWDDDAIIEECRFLSDPFFDVDEHYPELKRQAQEILSS